MSAPDPLAPTIPEPKRRILAKGWLPDTPDRNDYPFARLMTGKRTTPPQSIDLRGICPPILDQGDLGSCVPHSAGDAFRIALYRQGVAYNAFSPSRLFMYWNVRAMEGTVDSDSGAMIRDAVKSIAKHGVCTETRWPYIIEKFKVKAPTAAYIEALEHQALTYYRVGDTNLSTTAARLAEIRACLAAGFPIIIGFSVYESFETVKVARTGTGSLPKAGESMLGGHAVLLVGYDMKSKRFRFKNSWGKDWGAKGYFTLPFDYLLDPAMADDFWTVRLVETGLQAA